MNRIGGIVMAVGGWVARLAAGFAGMMLAVGVLMPAPAPDVPARPEPGPPGSARDTIALTVPEGELTGHLTVTDGSGRELVTLTSFRIGLIQMIARWRGGRDMSWSVERSRDRAALEWTGTTHTTCIEMNPDGTARSITRPSHRRGSLERHDDRVPPVPDEELPIFARSSPGPVCISEDHGPDSDGGSGQRGNPRQCGRLSPLDDRARDAAVMPGGPACP